MEPIGTVATPTVSALRAILADLTALPDSDKHKAAAVAKVQRQLDDLQKGDGA